VLGPELLALGPVPDPRRAPSQRRARNEDVDLVVHQDGDVCRIHWLQGLAILARGKTVPWERVRAELLERD
jgi:hypothetical protein